MTSFFSKNLLEMDASFNTNIIRGKIQFSNLLTKQNMINKGLYLTRALPTVGGAGSNTIMLDKITGGAFISPTECMNLNGFVHEPPPVINNGGSLLFPLSPSPYGYLSIPNSPDFSFGTGDFTVEWFQYLTEPNSFPRVFSIGSYSNDTLTIGVSIEGETFYFWMNNTPLFATSVSVVDTWVHFAVVRYSGSVSVYLNGTPIASPIVNSAALVNTINDLKIGNESEQSAEAAFTGYITNFRIVKGTAVYTSNFTAPSTQLTAIQNTVLLITAQNIATSFEDSSGTGKINTNTNVIWQSNSPFN
jgi:hypothetical protein